MIQQCIDLALGRAFTPDPLDPGMPLARRFARRPLLAVSLYKDGLEAASVTFENGAPAISAPEFRATGGEDADAAFLRSFADRFKARDCVVNLTTGYTAVLSTRARRPENDEEAVALMRDNPERLLGEAPAQGCRHSLAYHPTHNFAVAFAHKEHDITMALSLCAKADLQIARLQCGMSALLVQAIGNFWAEVGKEAELLFVDRSSVFYLQVSEGAFGRPLFDIGLKEAALGQALAERVGRLKAGGKVILVDSSGLNAEAMIAGRAAEITVAAPLKDSPSPTLAACCSDRPRLGADLYPNERTVRPCAPGRLRPVPLLFWASLAATAVVAGVNTFRAAQAGRIAAGLSGQAKMLDAARGQADGVMQAVEGRAKAASAMCDWLLISPATQPLLMDITTEIEAATEQGIRENKPVARVDSLSLTRLEGQPQMRLVVVAIGDAPGANRIFQRISTLFGRMGYSTVDLKETLVPQGFRYEHLVNLPRPSVMVTAETRSARSNPTLSFSASSAPPR